MPVNQYQPFAVGPSANALTPTAWALLTALIANGFVSGEAKSEQVNTLMRQLSVAVSALAQLTAEHQGADVLDDGSVTNFKNKLKAALDSLYVQDLSPYMQFANYTGSPEQSITTNGWQKLPGGFLFQWGRQAMPAGAPTGSVAVTFPRAFANGCYGVSLTPADGATPTWIPVTLVANGVNPSGFTLVADTGNGAEAIGAGRYAMWHAWGYDNTI